ncbi:hypothetical protein Q9966_016682 [Columba livia]|nr:hypothetical protein Q9966_016682 [Columba livia]
MFGKKKKRLEISAPSNFEHPRAHRLRRGPSSASPGCRASGRGCWRSRPSGPSRSWTRPASPASATRPPRLSRERRILPPTAPPPAAPPSRSAPRPKNPEPAPPEPPRSAPPSAAAPARAPLAAARAAARVARAVPRRAAAGGGSRRPPRLPGQLHQDRRGLHRRGVHRHGEELRQAGGRQEDGPAQAAAPGAALQRGGDHA